MIEKIGGIEVGVGMLINVGWEMGAVEVRISAEVGKSVSFGMGVVELQPVSKRMIRQKYLIKA